MKSIRMFRKAGHTESFKKLQSGGPAPSQVNAEISSVSGSEIQKSKGRSQTQAELQGQRYPKRRRTVEGSGQRPDPEGEGQKLQDVNLNPQIPQVGNFLIPQKILQGRISEFHKLWKNISMSNWLFSGIKGFTINEDEVELIPDKKGN